MHIVELYAENVKRLSAVRIAPDGRIVTIQGKNGAGKSSVLDAIWIGLQGKTVAPPRVIRKGQEVATIKLNLGELLITRTFTDKGGKVTDAVKVESADGSMKFNKPETVLRELLGEIGFDPFGFVQMEPQEQAKTLLQMVPLTVDLDDLADMDAADTERRRDINRDGKALAARLDAMPAVPADLPAEPIDKDAIIQALADAADTNSAIERDRVAREDRLRRIENIRIDSDRAKASAADLRAEAAQRIAEAEGREADAKSGIAEADKLAAEFEALPPIPVPVDTAALRQQLAAAEATNAHIAARQQRETMAKELEELREKSQAFTTSLDDRNALRMAALATAKMPIEGLSFGTDEKGKAVVEFNGVPFEQASSAEQLRASTAIAMAANPRLRVLRIKDGSLLDDDSMAILNELAAAEDFQLWIERVGTGGVGIVIEDGEVKAPENADAEPAEKPKGKAKAEPKAEGGLL